jgi:A/G-specific adenine glycosylase
MRIDKKSTRARAPNSAAAPDPSGLGENLLDWFDRHRRDLPWRAGPGERADPYAVWLSEIMLQQTTVATVRGYYADFLERWPTVEALAAAKLDDVLQAWAGLGYYARARNLHACAKHVAERCGGRFPESEAGLRELPGVGPYTAAAIAAIAHDLPCVAQDGNVERVISRLYAMETPLPAAKTEIAERTAQIMSRERPGDFAQALMDLGATICTPRNPACGICPFMQACAGRRADPLQFPRKAAKAPKPHRRGAAFVLKRCDEVLLIKRPPQGLLGAMAAFPTTPLSQDTPPEAQKRHAPAKARWRKLEGEVRHVFTHFSLALTIYVADGDAEGQWTRCAELEEQALPTLMRKVAVHADLISA